MPSYPRWLLPSGSDICPLIRMGLGLNSRTITHRAFADECGKLSQERAREIGRMRRNRRGRYSNAEKALQQIALLPYDDTLGR